MNRPLPTFSSLPRVRRCLGSAVLFSADTQSDHADAGSVRHHFFRRVSDLARGGMPLVAARELALVEAPASDRWELSLVDLHDLNLAKMNPEVAVAIDIVTGKARVLGQGIERRYDEAGRRPTEIAGSIDAYTLLGQDGALVRDYKGRSHDRRPEADEQLLAGAYAIARIHHRRWVDVEVVKVIGGRTFPLKTRVAAPDLERFGQTLKVLGTNVQEARAAFAAGTLPPCTEGDHCERCPSFAFCPPKHALARAAMGDALPQIIERARSGQPYLTDENAAVLHERLAVLEKVVKKMRADLRTRGAQRPIPLRNGKLYGLTRAGRVTTFRAPPQEAGHA